MMRKSETRHAPDPDIISPNCHLEKPVGPPQVCVRIEAHEIAYVHWRRQKKFDRDCLLSRHRGSNVAPVLADRVTHEPVGQLQDQSNVVVAGELSKSRAILIRKTLVLGSKLVSDSPELIQAVFINPHPIPCNPLDGVGDAPFVLRRSAVALVETVP